MDDKDFKQMPGAARKPSRAEEGSSGSCSSGFVGCWMECRHNHPGAGKKPSGKGLRTAVERALERGPARPQEQDHTVLPYARLGAERASTIRAVKNGRWVRRVIADLAHRTLGRQL
jgi:hypothetical protein